MIKNSKNSEKIEFYGFLKSLLFSKNMNQIQEWRSPVLILFFKTPSEQIGLLLDPICRANSTGVVIDGYKLPF